MSSYVRNLLDLIARSFSLWHLPTGDSSLSEAPSSKLNGEPEDAPKQPPISVPHTFAMSQRTVRQLFELIGQNIDVLEHSCAINRTELPDLNSPFHPSSEAFRADPAAAEAARVIGAAALQLAAVFLPPHVSLYHVIGGHFKSAAARVCLESNVTEILREAGPSGLSVEEIASRNGQDPQKLGRFLRLLATNHVYREVRPNVFANNRISSMLDTMKPSQDVISDPYHKHDGTSGLAALASHHLDEAFKASAYAWETLQNTVTSHSGEPSASPFATALNSQETLWQYFDRPEQSYRQRRFDVGMRGIQAMQPPDAIFNAFDWAALPPDSVVVDLGGGVGTSAMALARQLPQLNLIVQDLQGVIEDAWEIWTREMPDALNSGRVKLEVHDFFTPQPKRAVSVFLLKQVLHDWSDTYCLKILKLLKNAANEETKLVIMDSLIPFACHDPGSKDVDCIPGLVPREAPAPLLANYGVVNEMGYNADIDMFLLFNSQERTVLHFDQLFRDAGWRLTVVHRQEGDSTFLQSLEAVIT